MVFRSIRSCKCFILYTAVLLKHTSEHILPINALKQSKAGILDRLFPELSCC